MNAVFYGFYETRFVTGTVLLPDMMYRAQRLSHADVVAHARLCFSAMIWLMVMAPSRRM